MTSQLTLNLLEGSISFRCSPEAAQELKAALADLMDRLKALAVQGSGSGSRPQPQPPLEYQQVGEVFLEIFCNPNIWPSPFAAKVLITVRDDRIRLNSEAELTRVVEDVNAYLDQMG
jgi:hypothetical protein